MTREELIAEVVRLTDVLQMRDTQLVAEQGRSSRLLAENEQLRREHPLKPTSHVRGWS